MKWIIAVLMVIGCSAKLPTNEPEPTAATASEAAGCADGFFTIGGSRDYYCVSETLISKRTFWEAADYCGTLPQKARLCSATEFYTGCKEKGLTGSYQWIDDYSRL